MVPFARAHGALYIYKSLLLPTLIAALAALPFGRIGAQTLAVPYNFTWNANEAGTNSDGVNPGVLILSGDTFYGTTSSGGPTGSGTLFRVNTHGMGFTVLHYFAATAFDSQGNLTNSDGANPGGLILSGGTLYGTAPSGGLSGKGTVFSVSTIGMGFNLLHTFTVTDSDTRTNIDGAIPAGNLILSGSALYGTATFGGTGASGTLFAIDTNSLVFTNLYNFQGSNGAQPAIQVLSGNVLYATAAAGGQGSGLLFQINTDGTLWKLLHNFATTASVANTNGDGAKPNSLVWSGAILYGTASQGGAGGEGTVFSLNTNGLGFATLHSFAPVANSGNGFTNGDGTSPNAVIVSGSYLYGSAAGGGLSSGTVFGINTDGTGFTTLFTFAATTVIFTNDSLVATNIGGSQPDGALVLSGNTLYGTASLAGISGNGTIFALTLPPITPIPLYIQAAGDTMILSWTNALFYLQAAPAATGVFTNIPNSSSPYTNTATDPQLFFRLIAP